MLHEFKDVWCFSTGWAALGIKVRPPAWPAPLLPHTGLRGWGGASKCPYHQSTSDQLWFWGSIWGERREQLCVWGNVRKTIAFVCLGILLSLICHIMYCPCCYCFRSFLFGDGWVYVCWALVFQRPSGRDLSWVLEVPDCLLKYRFVYILESFFSKVSSLALASRNSQH